MTMARAVLFDIDGTLITTGGAGGRAWARAFQQLFGREADITRFSEVGMTDPDVARHTFTGTMGREPTDDELAVELDMPTDKVVRLKDTAQAITSLDTPIGDDGAALQDFLEDDSAVGPDELAVEAVGREALEQVLNALPERERQVLILRFGLDSGTPRTLEEVGAVMGFSRERARQVERDALASLRSPEIRARLEDLVAA